MRRTRIAAACTFLLLSATLLPPSPAQAAAAFASIDATSFVLDPGKSFDTNRKIIDRLEAAGTVTRPASLGAAIDGPQDFHPTWGLCHPTGIVTTLAPTGFCWDPADDDWDTANWRPQGLSGSWDAQPNLVWEGRRIAVASWHGIQDSDAFARLTFVDYTDTAHLKFRDVLLVVPVTVNGVDTFAPFNFNHADGVVWYGDSLLVANGGRLHAFSLSHLWTMTRSAEDIGLGTDGTAAPSARWHRYALPMMGEYYPDYVPTDGKYIGCTPVTGTRPCLNSISLDRRGANRDTMVSTEFVAADSAGGRAIRWPMNFLTALPLLGTDGLVHADEAYTSPIWHMQGAASDGTNWYLSGTCAGGSGTCIHKAVPGQAPHQQTTVNGGLENLSFQPAYNGSAARLWGINEGNNRFVFSAKVP
ncbi:hypothetical protein [Hamadaea tsunoensis]|uniref:hypothetical protein n=1 Tax=Hamadaea tsunoensis TaxID=53368 RepID=UPI0004214BD9|nr:hypothetical protein [Hamadaea tsunoensis]